MRALVNFDANGVVKKLGEKVSADELEQAGGKSLLGRLVSSDDAEVHAPVAVSPQPVAGQSMPSISVRVADALAKDAAAKAAAPVQQEEAGEGFDEEPAAPEAIPLSELDDGVSEVAAEEQPAHAAPKSKGKKKGK